MFKEYITLASTRSDPTTQNNATPKVLIPNTSDEENPEIKCLHKPIHMNIYTQTITIRLMNQAYEY